MTIRRERRKCPWARRRTAPLHAIRSTAIPSPCSGQALAVTRHGRDAHATGEKEAAAGATAPTAIKKKPIAQI